MLKALGFKSASPSPAPVTDPKHALGALEDAVSLERGLRAMDLVMDDRPSEAQKLLNDGSSTYDKLARGVIAFIEATLGFEADAIKHAVDTLYEAEQASQKDRSKAQKANIRSSSRYAPGTEYALTYAEAHLLGAISLFLSESMLDSAKALLRLRKAYQMLDELNRSVNTNPPSALPYMSSSSSLASSSAASLSSTANSGVQTPNSTHSSVDTKLSQTEAIQLKAKLFHEMKSKRFGRPLQTSNADGQNGQNGENGQTEDGYLINDGTVAGQQSVDEFIQSGVDTMFGLLQLVISIIPPGIGKVLSIVGFHGDKENGLRMLWRASKYTNIHGAIALLALLQFYDGPTQFSDIELPKKAGSSSDSDGSSGEDDLTTVAKEPQSLEDLNRTKHNLEKGLKVMRSFYPRGALWQLQEGRMVASKGNLEKAVEIMNDTSSGPIELKQLDGLMLFDKTIMMLVLHRFEDCAKNFIRLMNLNSWSHSLYMYLAGACYVEIYRENQQSNPEKAKEAKEKAKECIEKIPSLFGKKRFMAKTMPFDVFVLRKMNQWKSTAQEKGLHIVDAIGTSPVNEAIYFWNGFNKMPQNLLEESLRLLGYSGAPGSDYASDHDPVLAETEDESITRYILQSIALRQLGRVQEGVDLLDKHVMSKIWTPQPQKGTTKSGLPKVHYNKQYKDPWAGPTAIYERGIFEWRINGVQNADRVRDYLDLAMNWADDYELSTRVMMRIKSGMDRLELIARQNSK
uniref:ARAD1D21296p n=1 Tax=Blastobotrys adeninivorans TaxID=409370 RepID=A0A060TF93_BLAAD